MALANYADLVAAVKDWLNRGSDLDARIPDFIKLAETEFNRELRVTGMETRSTATLTDAAIAVPSDLIGLISLSMDNTILEQVTAGSLFDDKRTGGYPVRYAIIDGQFFFRPSPTSGVVTITYYASIPALTVSNTTNWLMTKHPDLYLAGTLFHAAKFIRDTEYMAEARAEIAGLIGQIMAAEATEKFGGHRLSPAVCPP